MNWVPIILVFSNLVLFLVVALISIFRMKAGIFGIIHMVYLMPITLVFSLFAAFSISLYTDGSELSFDREFSNFRKNFLERTSVELKMAFVHFIIYALTIFTFYPGQ